MTPPPSPEPQAIPDAIPEPPLTQWADAIEARFPTRHGRVEVYASTTSTQDAARRRVTADPHHAHGLVVTTGHQTAGRGRLGRQWSAPGDTCLTLSAAYRLGDLPADRLSFATSVALAETLDDSLRHVNQTATIKWPNDIYVAGQKIAGILVEQANGVAIIGIGININTSREAFPSALRHPATSLTLCGAHTHRLNVLLHLLPRLDHALKDRPLQDLLTAWRQRSTLLAQSIRFAHNGESITGHVIDLDPQAGLIVRRNSGELIHLPAATTSVMDPQKDT
ncbi:MAG: biotin--[acetyl-CoA-carboxylase] ligase [Algisphaera sp.]